VNDTGTFIISLDCEGKWGMADTLQPVHQQLTDDSLARAYDQLVTLFGRYDVPATFAYVMAFTLTPEERRGFAHILEPRPDHEDRWVAHHWSDLRAGRDQGWFQPHALDVVKADGRHEIACHGFSHRSLADQAASPEAAEADLAAAIAAARMKGVRLSTLVFPRNEVGNLDVVRKLGFLGYRDRLRRSGGSAWPLLRLAEEFNVWPALQHGRPPRAEDGLVRIPAGYFFNWRHGARRYVPAGVTIRRWDSLLTRSARHGSVAHLWLHPHNLITAPSTAETLEAVVARAARLRDEGKLRIETQQAYCLRMLGLEPTIGPAAPVTATEPAAGRRAAVAAG
jgi:peptidoglycan/xylan/chitin deacetylase (PgdA/CDA1 family)